jgi:hypothetical protein
MLDAFALWSNGKSTVRASHMKCGVWTHDHKRNPNIIVFLTPKAQYALIRQPDAIKGICIQKSLRYGEFDYDRSLKIESDITLIMT